MASESSGISVVSTWMVPIRAILLLFIIIGQADCRAIEAAPTPPLKKNILLLKSYGHGSRGLATLDDGLVSTLNAGGISTNNLFFEYLDLERNKDDPGYRQQLKELLKRKHSNRRIDAIYTGQQPALGFLLNEGRDLAPGIPVVTVQAPTPSPAEAGGRPVVSLLANFDIKGTLERALELFPHTRRVLIVSGSSEADRKVAASAAKFAEPWKDRLDLEFTTDLTLSALFEKVATLPAQTVIIFTQHNRDAAGQVTVAYEVEAMIVKAANAPVFGLYDFNLNNGGIGGSVVGVKNLGAVAGKALIDILNEKFDLTKPVVKVEIQSIPTFDWGQIKRFGGDPNRLSGSPIFVNRVPTFWEQYKLYVIGLVILILAQSLLIAVLLLNRRRRKQAERVLRENEESLRITLQSIGDAVLATDDRGRVTRMNPVAERLSGWTLADAAGRPLSEVFRIVNADTRETVVDPVQLALERGQVVGLGNHTALLARDGREYQIADSAAPIRNGEGQIVGVVLVFSDVTETYLKERLLKEEQLFSRKILDSLPGIFYLYSYPELRLQQWNKHHEVLLGYGPEEMKGRLATDWVAQEHRDAILSAIEVVMAQGQYSIEAPLLAKDGHPVHFFLTGVRLESQGRNYFVGTGTDISEHKRAEALLQDSEARFRSLTEMSSDFYWETDAEHRLTQRTESRREVAEDAFKEASSIGKRRWEIPYLAPDESAWRKHRATLDAHLLFRNFEILRLRANGAKHYISVSGDPVFDAAGEFTGYRGVGTDITTRKHQEDQTRQLTREVEAILRNAPVGIAYLKQRQIVSCNRRLEEIFGYAPGELNNELTRKLYDTEETFIGVGERAYADLDKNNSYNEELPLKKKDGTVFWGALTGCAIDPAYPHEGSIWIYSDITERKKAEVEINTLAFYDPLTQLPNRRLLFDRLKQALAASSRSGKYGALLFIDLDNFKTLNDTFGHDIGDLLLKQVAERLLACVREGDTVARLGGDEFVLMLEDLSGTGTEAATLTEAVGDKIISALNHPYQLGDTTHHSTPSIGVTLFSGEHGTIDELLKRADVAMYQAKHAGRNTLRFFDPELQAIVAKRVALEADLRDAVRHGQFVLHYQVQVVGEGRWTGAEVLLRWRHPGRGMVSPAEFIPLAEDSGLILPIGEWVLRTACNQLALWADRKEMVDLTLAVNVSAKQFRHKDFVDQVLAVLDSSGANPQRLKLELTESLLVEDVEDIIAKMSALKAKGVGFSLDDFGTGYSSLAYLKRMPLDQLKIDQGFVRDILTDPNDAAIAKMVIALAESMGLAVIAEGVEIEAQRDFLARHGCHAYQGYLFGRPVPLDEFEASVQRV